MRFPAIALAAALTIASSAALPARANAAIAVDRAVAQSAPGLCNTPGVPTMSVYLPNITRYLGGRDGWYTPFIVQNTGSAPTTLNVSFYKFTDGSLVTCRTIPNLAAGHVVRRRADQRPDLPFDAQFSVVVEELRLDDRLRRERARRLGRARRGDVVRRRRVRRRERLPAEHHPPLLRLRHAVHHPEPRHRADDRDRAVRQLRRHRADGHRDPDHRSGPLAVHRSELRARPRRRASVRRSPSPPRSRSRSS